MHKKVKFGQAVASMHKLKSYFNKPEKSFDEHDWLQFFCNLNSPKIFTCPLGNLRTEFTILIHVAKSTCPRLSDMPFFAR